MPDFDLIIFDCDGTLTDSEGVNNAAFMQILQEDGFPAYDQEHVEKHWTGKTASNILLMLQMETGIAPSGDFVPRYIKRVSELQMTDLRAVEGASALVTAAKAKFKICVASNGERSNVLRSLELTGLMDNFTVSTVFTKIQVKNPKPHPDLFLFAASQMGVPFDRCLVIEDSASGVHAARAAYMNVWGFTGSAHDPAKQQETLKSAGAHEVFSRLIHIQERLGL